MVEKTKTVEEVCPPTITANHCIYRVELELQRGAKIEGINLDVTQSNRFVESVETQPQPIENTPKSAESGLPNSLVAVIFIPTMLVLFGSIIWGLVWWSYKVKPSPSMLLAGSADEPEAYKYQMGEKTKLGLTDTVEMYPENPWSNMGEIKPDNYIDQAEKVAEDKFKELNGDAANNLIDLANRLGDLQATVEHLCELNRRRDLAYNPRRVDSVDTPETPEVQGKVQGQGQVQPSSSGPSSGSSSASKFRSPAEPHIDSREVEKDDISRLSAKDFKEFYPAGNHKIERVLTDKESAIYARESIIDFAETFNRLNIEFCVWYVFGLHKTGGVEKGALYQKAFQFCRKTIK